MVVVTKVSLTLQIGRSPPREYEVFISPIPENILGLAILQSQTLHACVGEFHVGVRVIEPVLRGNANRELLSLQPPQRAVTVK